MARRDERAAAGLSLAELLAVSLLPGRVTATASVVEE